MDRKNQQKLLLLGPVPPPWTGQALAFWALLDSEKLRKAFDIAIVDLNMEKMSKCWKVLLTGKALFQFIARVFRRKPELVYLLVSRSKLGCLKDCFVMILSGLVGAKVIVHVHGGNLGVFYKNCGLILRAIVRYSYRRVSCGIALGESLRDQFEGLLPNERVQVVVNCYPEHEISNLHERLARRTGQDLRVLFLSNVLPSKGIFDALYGLSLAVKRGIPIEFTFAGDFLDNDSAFTAIPESQHENLDSKAIAEKYEKLIRDIGIDNRVRKRGVITGHDKWNLLAQSDILLLPIYNPVEGQPLTIIEAMRSGCAIITTNCGGIADIMEDGVTGKIVRPRCPEDIADAIEWLWKNPERLEEIGRNNQQRAIKLHNRETHVNKMISIFVDTLRNGSTSGCWHSIRQISNPEDNVVDELSGK